MELLPRMLSAGTGDLTRHLAIGGLLILAMVVGGSVLIPWLRRQFHPSGRTRDETLDRGFTIGRLEAMRREGEISDEEFRVLRRSALGLDAGPGKTHNSASSSPAKRDDDEGTVRTDEFRADRDVQEE